MSAHVGRGACVLGELFITFHYFNYDSFPPEIKVVHKAQPNIVYFFFCLIVDSVTYFSFVTSGLLLNCENLYACISY